MRRLVFNGCSFVHGFDAAWDYDLNPKLSEDVRNMGGEYWKKLQNHNLSGVVSRKLGVSSVHNLARNGNTNDLIMFETMRYLEQLEPGIEPVVLVGWTEPARLMVFNEQDDNAILSVNPFIIDHWIKNIAAYYDDERSKYLLKFYLRHVEASRHLTRMLTDDLLASYLFKHVLCLQNYLERKNIPYVFWNSIHGTKLPSSSTMKDALGMINVENWFACDTREGLHPIEDGWRLHIKESEYTRTCHPTIAAIEKFAESLAGFVAKKDWFNG